MMLLYFLKETAFELYIVSTCGMQSYKAQWSHATDSPLAMFLKGVPWHYKEHSKSRLRSKWHSIVFKPQIQRRDCIVQI